MSNLGASLITFSPSTTIKSADVNSNLANLNNAANPTFTVATATTGFNGPYGTFRNNVLTYVNFYSGTSTPTGSPPTGSWWAKA